MVNLDVNHGQGMKINWEAMFWKLAALVLMGWTDEAKRMICLVVDTPLVVWNDFAKTD